MFAERLKSLRLETNTPQFELANLLSVSVRAYQYYESGKRQPTIENLIALADYFNVSLDYLCGRSDMR